MLAQTALAALALSASMASAAAVTPTQPQNGTGVLSAPKEKRTTHVGIGTPYYQEGVAGSCGNYNSDSAIITALSNYWMDDEFQSPYCGRLIQVTNTGSPDGLVGGQGNTIVVTVQDTCPGCTENNLDFSIGAWNELTNGATPNDNFNIEWHFCNVDSQC